MAKQLATPYFEEPPESRKVFEEIIRKHKELSEELNANAPNIENISDMLTTILDRHNAERDKKRSEQIDALHDEIAALRKDSENASKENRAIRPAEIVIIVLTSLSVLTAIAAILISKGFL